jgi:hypothetical protein
MGTANHRTCALAEDRNPAWTLPDPVEDSETEAEALAGLAQCNSLLTMGGTKPKKKKRPVLLLDPEEAARAHSQMALTAAQDFADPESAAARQPTLGLSARDAQRDTVKASGSSETREDSREWAARGPSPLSSSPLETTPDFESSDSRSTATPQSQATSPLRTIPDDDTADDTDAPVSHPTQAEPPRVLRSHDRLSNAPALAMHGDAPRPRSTPSLRERNYIEVPFENEIPAPAEAMTAPVAPQPALSPKPNRLRRHVRPQPIRSEPAESSFAGLLARLRAAIERMTWRH